jgi:plastocyanin
MPSRLSPASLPPLGFAFALALILTASRVLAAGGVNVSVKDNKAQPVADAVVSLVPLDAPAKLTPPAGPLVISQSGQEFDPYVTALVVGTRVAFPNRDTVRHQVYSLSAPKPFEIPLYGPGAGETLAFDKPGVVSLGCNIHDWMSAHVVVLATPFFKKTPAAGTALLADLPPGRYRLDVWHPRLATDARREVTIAPGDSPMQTISIVLKPDRRIRRAPDGAGGGYK